MAACDGLQQHIFEKPLPLESLSPWKHVKSMRTVDHYSFTEIFGQLYLKEDHHVLDHSLQSSTSSSPFPPSSLSSSLTSNSVFPHDESGIHQEKKQHWRNDSISSVNSECLSTCTEELGFESSDDVEDFLKNDDNDWKPQEERTRRCTRTDYEKYWCGSKRHSRRNMGTFPPPISCIGRNGKPWVSFKSVREDGRFILTEIRVPTQEFLHTCRKNGRLKMQFIHSDDELPDEDEEGDEEENVEESYGGMSEVEDGDGEVTEA